MKFDADRLYALLPAIYRIRDAEQGLPLKALLAVIAEQIGVLEEDLDRLLDDQFVETCAPWVLPYLADLVGLKGVRGVGQVHINPRAEVANTIRYRRRKGTAAVLEQLARDVTGWPARAVEFFQLLATTQYVNHLRLANYSFLNVRDAYRLESLGGPFEHLAGSNDLTHTADVRRIASGRGRYNVPNVGLFLWRLRPYSLTRSPAVPAAPLDTRRFLFSPLGNNVPLFNLPVTEEDFTQSAAPVNVAGRIGRRDLAAHTADYYGHSLLLDDGTGDRAADQIDVCDLSDDKGTWAHLPSSKITIDPVLGRIAFPADQSRPPLVTFHYGFSADVGGGEYDRTASFTPGLRPVLRVGGTAPDFPTIEAALNGLGAGGGVVEVADSGRYEETLTLAVGDRTIELRAADKQRPTVVLGAAWSITGGSVGTLTVNGLLVAGAALSAGQGLGSLRLRHCTLVPGLSLKIDGTTAQPAAPSLIVQGTTQAKLDQCIVGGIRSDPDARIQLTGSIVDATQESGVAYAAPANDDAGGPVKAVNCTIIGKVNTDTLELASNTIFLASLASGDPWPAPVQAQRRQEGCVRFCYVPLDARVPRRYRCQPATPADAARVRPILSSARYAAPDYCQLSRRCALEILHGADDEAEMGVFHDLYQPQREAHLRARLQEYLRFGLEAGVFYVT
jgi:hypothetical protein